MKQIFIFSLLIAFAYAGFRPPEGMRKFPVANLQFQVQSAQGTATVTLQEDLVTSVTQESEQEEEK
ncbi:MAG: hypothetical protein QF793_01555 [Candidatus Peribacteraceae bacterium]|jgi:hypothetical protein|nr:hypothetical protein [bacterium]MDP6561589.1 hypothetical protein [Candidatus Peribacteraceae bacterium]|tara:strand:+ start:43040 stop:43237 length:198 start_codon:yes stop_codon:yes gene_type:complete